jgi:hypothetical protein
MIDDTTQFIIVGTLATRQLLFALVFIYQTMRSPLIEFLKQSEFVRRFEQLHRPFSQAIIHR